MGTNAALYQRVSDGTDKSVEEQNKANEEAARESGWDTTRFSDAVSASRFSRKARPGWAELTAAVAAGRFGYVVLWESSRGDRTLASWATFLDACRETGTKIYVTSQDRVFDLSNGYDWRALAAEGVDAAFESEKISKRSRRGVAGAVEMGLPYGRIPYGYKRTYTREPGRARPLPHQEPDPNEAPVVREAIERIARGEAISAILRDFTERGVTTRAGKPWSRPSLTRLVTEGVIYIGKRRHNGSPLIDGNWPPLVSEEDYWRAFAVLSNPARKPSGGGIRPGRTRWLLSYITECGVCHGPISCRHVPRTTGQVAYYRCVRKGCVSAPVAFLDELATVGVVMFCASSPLYEVLTRGDDKEAQATRDEAEAEAERLRGFEEQAISGSLSAESFSRIASGIEARINELEARARELSAPPALRELRSAATAPEERQEDIYRRWLGMPLTARRAVLTAIFAPVLFPAKDPADRNRFKMPLRPGLR